MSEAVQKARLIPVNQLDKIAELLARQEAVCFSRPWNYLQIFGSISGQGSAVILLPDQGSALNSLETSILEGCDIIGYAILNLFPGEPTCELLRIAIQPRMRNSGAGVRLLEACLKHVRQYWQEYYATTRGRIILEVAANNAAALKLYKKFGFVLIHTRREYYGDQDALIMEWQAT